MLNSLVPFLCPLCLQKRKRELANEVRCGLAHVLACLCLLLKQGFFTLENDFWNLCSLSQSQNVSHTYQESLYVFFLYALKFSAVKVHFDYKPEKKKKSDASLQEKVMRHENVLKIVTS